MSLALRIRILSVALVGFAGPATAQPSFSDPALLLGDAVIGPAAGEQSNVRVALGGGQYLAVWEDESSAYGGEQTGVDVFGMRIDLAGNPIDPTPFPIDVGFGSQQAPQVAWNGQTWLVTYSSQVKTQSFYETAIVGRRVSTAGQVLDAAPIVVASLGSGGSSALAAMNQQWVVVTQSHDAGQGGIKARRIDANGQFLDPTPVLLVPPSYYIFTTRVFSTATELLVGWNPTVSGALVARRFDANLQPIGAPFPLPTADTIASNGASYYATWTSGSNYVGSPMSNTGALQFPAGVVIGPTYQTYAPRISWAANHWWASWTQINRGLKIARIRPQGAVLDPGGILVPYTTTATGFLAQHAASGGPAGELLLAFTDNGSGFTSSYDIVGIPVGATATVGAARRLSVAAPHQQRPHLAEGPGQVLASFVSEVSGVRRAMIQRLLPDGTPIDAAPTEVAAHEFVGSIRAAWDGIRYLVTWSENGEIYGRRLLPDGTWVDSARFHILKGGSPDVAALNGQFMVVGSQFGTSVHNLSPVAQRIDAATGAKLGSSQVLGWSYAQGPRVLTVGNRWLAAWQRNYTHDDPQAEIQAAFVDTNGVATPQFIVAFNGFTPSMATSGNEVMFVYRTGSNAAAQNDISARRMLPDGTFPEPAFVVTAAPAKQVAPTVTFDGHVFLAAWEDRRDGDVFFDLRTDVYGARILKDGTLLDPASFPIALAEAGEARPALTTVEGRVLLAASTFRDDPGFASWRIETRITDSCGGAFTDYGSACAGSGGLLPHLGGTGCPVTGESFAIVIEDCLGGALAYLVLGSGEGNVPLQGCTLLVQPLYPVAPLFTLAGTGAGNGTATIAGVIPSLSSTTSIWLQALILDGGAPNGLSASNGLKLVVN